MYGVLAIAHTCMQAVLQEKESELQRLRSQQHSGDVSGEHSAPLATLDTPTDTHADTTTDAHADAHTDSTSALQHTDTAKSHTAVHTADADVHSPSVQLHIERLQSDLADMQARLRDAISANVEQEYQSRTDKKLVMQLERTVGQLEQKVLHLYTYACMGMSAHTYTQLLRVLGCMYYDDVSACIRILRGSCACTV